MRQARTFRLVITLLIVGAFALTALMTAPAWAAKAPDKIRIGYTLSLSGKFTTLVGPFKKLGDNWAKLTNERGGIYVKEYGKKLPIEFVVYDDKSDPATSAKFYERLVTQDKVHFLLGPFSSHISYAATTVAEKHKVPMMLICANDLKLFERQYKYSVTNLAPANTELERYLQIIKAEGKAETLAILAEDTLHSTGVLTGGVDKANELGFKIVLKEIVPAGTRDFTALITRIKAKNPDIVIVEAFPPFEIPFAKQAHEFKLRPKELFFGHITKAVADAIGKGAENLTTSAPWASEWTHNPGVKDYHTILERTGITFPQYMESSIRMWAYQELKLVIEKAGSLDREKIRKVMWKTSIPTISGVAKHNKRGIGNLQNSPMQFRNGRFYSLYPIENARKNHVYPNPWK